MSTLGRAAGILVAFGTVASACRLEKRPDLEEAQGAGDAPSLSSVSSVEDSARAALVALSDALESGDGARVARLTTQDVILFDQDERAPWTRSDSISLLPPALSGGLDGLGWRAVESSFFLLGRDAAFFSLSYQASPAAEQLSRTALESWVLVRTEAGWRVRYLHRSRGLIEGGSQRR